MSNWAGDLWATLMAAERSEVWALDWELKPRVITVSATGRQSDLDQAT